MGMCYKTYTPWSWLLKEAVCAMSDLMIIIMRNPLSVITRLLRLGTVLKIAPSFSTNEKQ